MPATTATGLCPDGAWPTQPSADGAGARNGGRKDDLGVGLLSGTKGDKRIAKAKKFREAFGHTPLSVEENIPRKCACLVIGTGAYGRLPVMADVKREAQDRGVELVVLPTAEAIKVLQKQPKKTNAVLHVTC